MSEENYFNFATLLLIETNYRPVPVPGKYHTQKIKEIYPIYDTDSHNTTTLPGTVGP